MSESIPQSATSSATRSSSTSSDKKSSGRRAIRAHKLNSVDKQLGRATPRQELSSDEPVTQETAYRSGAECTRDEDLFLRSISRFTEILWTIAPLSQYPDVVCSFTLSKPILPRDLLWIALPIVNGYVQVQTLEVAHNYMGNATVTDDSTPVTQSTSHQRLSWLNSTMKCSGTWNHKSFFSLMRGNFL